MAVLTARLCVRVFLCVCVCVCVCVYHIATAYRNCIHMLSWVSGETFSFIVLQLCRAQSTRQRVA